MTQTFITPFDELRGRLETLLKLLAACLLAGWLLSALTIRR